MTRKSQIAITFCYQFRDQYPNRHVFWVYASSVQRFEQGYTDIARRLKLPGYDRPEVNQLELVSDWLSDETHEPWLMLIDNADDEGVFFNTQSAVLSQLSTPKALVRYIP